MNESQTFLFPWLSRIKAILLMMRQSISKFVLNAARIVFDLLDKGLGLGLGRVRVREFRVCSSSVPEM